MRGVSTSELAAVRVKLNSVKFKCYEIWSNGVKIWPREKYVIVEASVIYTESEMAGSVNYITACADNHATIVGTVEKRNGVTVIETLTDQVLVPDLTGATGFYLDDKEIHAYDLEQTKTAINNPTITCKYVTEDEVPVESEPFEIEIVQQGNQSSTSDSIVSVGIGSGLQDSNFTINGGSTTFTATKVVHRTTTWTSGHQSTEYGIPINISDNVSYVISSGTEGGSLLGKVFTAQTRVQKESRGNWNIVGTYIYEGATYQPTMTITQDCDTKLSENVYYENFRVSIDVGRVITPINAQGGEVELNAGGMYDRIQTTTWQSDPLSPVVNPARDIPSYPTITEAGSSRFHRNGARVTHDNMTTNKTTDNVTYTATLVVDGVSRKTDTLSLSATNGEKATREAISSFQVGISNSSFGVYGGEGTLSARTISTIYSILDSSTSSVTYEIIKSTGNVTIVTSDTTFSISPSSSGAYIEGLTLRVASRVENDEAGSWMVTGVWNGWSDGEPVSQEADTYEDTVSHINYWASIGVGYVYATINAKGGKVDLNWSGGHTRRVHRVWATGGEYNYDSSVYDSVTVTGGGTRFTRNGATVTHDNMTTNRTTDTATYYATVYVDGVQKAQDSVTLSATNGERTTRNATTGFVIGVSPSDFRYYGGTASLSAEKIYTVYSILDSSTESTIYEIIKSTGNHTSVIGDTSFSISGSDGASISGTNLTVRTRKEMTDSGSWTVTGTWNDGSGSRTSSVPVTQDADTCETEYNDIDYWASIGVYGHQGESVVEIGAKEETFTLVPTAGHNHQEKVTWGSGGVYRYNNAVQDTPVVSGSASYFTRNGYYVTHENMGQRYNSILGYGLDSVTYYATNNGVSNSVTIKAKNYRTPLPDVTTEFHIQTPSKVSSAGGNVTVKGIRVYKTNRYVFSSEAIIESTPTTQTVSLSNITFDSQPSWIYNKQGASFSVYSNADNNPSRSASFSATYDGITDSSIVEQWEGTVRTTEYRCTSLSVNSSSVSAASYGSGSKVGISYAFQKTVTTKTDGVTTEGSWGAITSSDEQAMYLSGPYASHFTLYNGTTGNSGQGVIVHGGDSMYIYPISANTDNYSKSVTISESASSRTTDFKHDAVQRQTMYFN